MPEEIPLLDPAFDSDGFDLPDDLPLEFPEFWDGFSPARVTEYL